MLIPRKVIGRIARMRSAESRTHRLTEQLARFVAIVSDEISASAAWIAEAPYSIQWTMTATGGYKVRQ
ncbi:MAG: hypothetical protein C5B53_00490 [Candidatus Melainabacteria bacterium]|nr:MAG: hypothetical protein C5B53_00490 [Candidatus Melainabacteria bacterium]